MNVFITNTSLKACQVVDNLANSKLQNKKLRTLKKL